MRASWYQIKISSLWGVTWINARADRWTLSDVGEIHELLFTHLNVWHFISLAIWFSSCCCLVVTLFGTIFLSQRIYPCRTYGYVGMSAFTFCWLLFQISLWYSVDAIILSHGKWDTSMLHGETVPPIWFFPTSISYLLMSGLLCFFVARYLKATGAPLTWAFESHRIAKALSSCSESTGDIINTTERLKQELDITIQRQEIASCFLRDYQLSNEEVLTNLWLYIILSFWVFFFFCQVCNYSNVNTDKCIKGWRAQWKFLQGTRSCSRNSCQL